MKDELSDFEPGGAITGIVPAGFKSQKHLQVVVFSTLCFTLDFLICKDLYILTIIFYGGSWPIKKQPLSCCGILSILKLALLMICDNLSTGYSLLFQ
jgi:hypothetical protein